MSNDNLPPGLRNLTRVAQVCLQALDAPSDLPLARFAVEALAASILSLQDRCDGADLVARRVLDAYVELAPRVAEGATILALSRRVGRHLLYALAVHIGKAADDGQVLDPIVLELVGAWFLVRLLKDAQPSPRAVAKASAALFRPASKVAQDWTAKARTRSHAAALAALEKAIALNPSAAAAYGLVAARKGQSATDNPIEAFNRGFRCRMRMLYQFAGRPAKAGAGGHGTLPADALRAAGRELLAGVDAGDASSAGVCLEVISHVSSELVHRLPVQVGAEPPAGALAWLDVAHGLYCYILYDVVKKGARPEKGTEHLYEATVQVVTVDLTPPLTRFLQAAAAARTTPATCAQQLLGTSCHSPYARVAGQGAYRFTPRRIADSLPPVLLAQGFKRWPVALGTSSRFLVPQGRPFYGACRTQHIDAVVAAAYSALDWPAPRSTRPSGLVGAFVTPKPDAITALLNHLARQADRANDLQTFAGIVDCLNRHAAWLAALWALSFALREWLDYALPGDQLRAGHGVIFDEKELHAIAGAAVPVAALVAQTLRGWDELVARACTALDALGDAAGVELASKIRAWTADPRRAPPVFEIDAAFDVQAVGHLTWSVGLPLHVRLVLNFGRHFWPLQLLDRGVPQLIVDILMRQQQEDLHAGSSHRTGVRADEMSRLAAVINEVIAGLGLRVPQLLKGE